MQLIEIIINYDYNAILLATLVAIITNIFNIS